MDESVPAHWDAPASSSRESASESRGKVVSGKHRIYTHFPKDRSCEICKRTKITRAPFRKRTGAAVLRAEHFGDLITAQITKFFVQDVNLETIIDMLSWYKIWQLNGFNLIRAKPKLLRGRKRQRFLQPTGKPKFIYTDNSLEFGKACEDLSWNHCTSTPHRSETNGIPERAVRRIKEGTSAVQLKAGLDEKWWSDSIECYCYLRNRQDPLSDGKTLFERRFGEQFNGPVIPFGSMVEYHPISRQDLLRQHKCGPKVLPGKFLGYVLNAGEIWKGDILGRRH